MSAETSKPKASADAQAHILLKAFLETIPDNVYFKDEQSRFLALSRSMLRYFGTANTEEMVGKSDFDFFTEEHARPAYDDEQAILRTGRPILNKLEKETWPGGEITWALTSKMPLKSKEGQVIGTFGVSKDVTESVAMEKALEEANKRLIDASRQAGMAEVATGVLHNVGNVLNSVKVSSSFIADRMRASKLPALARTCELMRQHGENLGNFISTDPKGAQLLPYLEALSKTLAKEQEEINTEVVTLLKSVEHIRDIIWMQQSYATVAGTTEPIDGAGAIEDAIKLSNSALLRHSVRVERDFRTASPIKGERHKILQILVNLISNAKRAMDTKEPSLRHLILRVEQLNDDTIRISAIDNGVGISAENITKIFQHGFTTRKDGHGFGLHSSALAAKQMGGALIATSPGPGQGATFTLDLPAWKETAAHAKAASADQSLTATRTARA